MIEGQTVIYTARTVQEAHLLKNLLAQEQIEAVVLTDSSQLGLGAEAAGWATAAKVAVADQDAPRAKQIAVRFDRKMALAARELGQDGRTEDESLPAGPIWPTCPECHARRSTRCPVCNTYGTEFPTPDMGFIWIPDPGEAADCGGCASPGCPAKPSGADGSTGADDASTTSQDQPPSPSEMLVCTTCDEPFQPQYACRCEACGHQFAEGFEPQPPPDPTEQADSRVLVVVVGLLLLLGGLLAYFVFILSEPASGQCYWAARLGHDHAMQLDDFGQRKVSHQLSRS